MSSNQYNTSGEKSSNPFFKDQTPNPIYNVQMVKKPVTSNAILNSTLYTCTEPVSVPQPRPVPLTNQFKKFNTPEQRKNGLTLNNETPTILKDIPSIPAIVGSYQIQKQPLPSVQRKTPLTTKSKLFPANSTFNQGFNTVENNPNLKKLDLASRVKKKDEPFPNLPLSFAPVIKEIPKVPTTIPPPPIPTLKPDEEVILEDSGEHEDTGIKHSPMELPAAPYTYQNVTFSDMPFSQWEDKEEEQKKEKANPEKKEDNPDDFGNSSTDDDIPKPTDDDIHIPNFEVPTLDISDLDVEIPDMDLLTENMSKRIQTLDDTLEVSKVIASNKLLLAKALMRSTDDIKNDMASFILASDLKRKAPPTHTEEVVPSKVAKITKDITILHEVPIQPEVPVQPEIVLQVVEEPYRLVKMGNGQWKLIIDPNTKDKLVIEIKI